MAQKHSDISHLRKEYSLKMLSESDADASPFSQFKKWLDEALGAAVPEPTAMVLATVGEASRPRTRVVLLKKVDERGFCFFTNYNSVKGRHLAGNLHAALNFHWVELERQVCIEGDVEKMSREESEEYFRGRPRPSQIGAWVSSQSTVVAGREALEKLKVEREKEFGDKVIPLPPYWGGYRLVPEAVEFWQGRASRLHDRLRYTRHISKPWLRERLAP